jgi:quercetin dioxygenase-like cupin family protein
MIYDFLNTVWPYVAIAVAVAIWVAFYAGKTKLIFPKGEKALSEFFVGDSYVNMLVTDESKMYNAQVYNVLFEKGSRNNWHTHAAGQILLATSGEGLYQERGKVPQRLKVGDVVEIPPNVEHWHGATTNSDFTHIGISPNLDKGGITWLEAVSNEEYAKANK